MTDGPALGRYILERRIASGGMADVYLARQTGAYGFVKHVALKVLKREIASDDENVKMFIREALLSAEFRHTNLAQTYEVGEADGKLFIAMELVRGVSVASMLQGLADHNKPMPSNVAVRIAIDTLDGLAYAHEAQGPDGKPLGLVHRDVSPQNIMVAVDGTVKVVDFGIARAEVAFGRTMAPRIKGKFSYMPPEQWEAGGSIDARADLFAVGVVLYEMTTGGQRLFRGETPKDVYKAIVMDRVPDPRTRVPDYPPELAKIVMRALERGPGARWQSARAFRTALLEFAQGKGWSLTSRAVADALRSAIGTSDIEARWEQVASPASLEESTVVDVPTSLERPAPAARPSVPRAPEAPRPAVGATVAVAGGMLALVLGTLGGFALGRRAGRSEALARSNAVTGTPVRTLRVRGTRLLLADEGARALHDRWQLAHPEITLELSPATPSEALTALTAARADVALALRRATDAEVQGASARGVDLSLDRAHTRVGAGVAVLVVHPGNAVAQLSLEQARGLFATTPQPPTWDALGGPALPVAPLRRPPVTELLALAAQALSPTEPSPPGVTIESDADARARVAAEPGAVTVLELAASESQTPAVRVVPVRDGAPTATPARGEALAFPLWAITRGAPSGDARAFIDWLRAPDQDAVLRARSVTR